ncbi:MULTISPECIES: HNH endonuclease [unclassified Paenibacillus]|uniref:HNH endonuclease n=1 Tax=unclassified Paenibacillus TaxID=185978 RepID=UPI000897A65E|nr:MULTISPECIES: HNH endonuclease [unclassified Paenibacillus]MCM3130977.1 HNH endonuclease [Paenibacillus sp. MER 78]SDX04745.1 GcrA cell cycle regulator [Paenibacillus sp. PDC88]
MAARKWSDEELESLKQMFINGVPDEDIAKKLNRTKDAVKVKRVRAGITGDHNNRRWSEKSLKSISEARKRIPREKHPSWKGGRRITSNGYIEIRMPEHHRARGNGYVFEHIIVAEKILGRKLAPWENVHHKDRNKENNHPDNLEVLSASEHTKKHSADKPKTGSYLNCVVCGSTFYRKKSHVQKAKCCSVKCVGKYTNMKRKGEFKIAE